MIVKKFGGTSVKDAAAFVKVWEIVSAGTEKSIVVLSACAGVTNSLIELSGFAASNDRTSLHSKLSELKERHLKILSDLIGSHPAYPEAKHSVESRLAYLETYLAGISYLREASLKSKDTVLSFGELLSTEIFYWFARSRNSKIKLINAGKLIATDDKHGAALVDFNQTFEKINSEFPDIFSKADILLTQGFIASSQAGSVTTLGRGGSDYTAAILGFSCNRQFEKVDEIQIWTDVNGVMSADPRIVPGAVTLPVMSFDLVRELSFYGAKVLHPETIKPAIEGNIPVRVLNTHNPSNTGTLILDNIALQQASGYSLLIKNNIGLSDCRSRNFIKRMDSNENDKNDAILKIENEINHLEIFDLTYNIELNEKNIKVKMAGIFGENLNIQNENLRKAIDYLLDLSPVLILYGHSQYSLLCFFKPDSEIVPAELHKLLI